MKDKKVEVRETQSSSQTDKSRYPSLFTDKFITLPQYLAELMCDRRAKTLKRDLPKQFWNNIPEWKNYFMFQLREARQLCNKYSEHSIYQAVNELKYAYSLRTKKLVILIQKYESVRPPDIEDIKLDKHENSKGRFDRPKSKWNNLDE